MIPISSNRKLIRTIPSRRRLFTPERAGRTLVLVKRIVADLVRSNRRAGELQESLEVAQSAGLESLAATVREDLLQAGETIRLCLDELEDVGAEMQDFRLGLVDFPARQGRREVRLCWQWGEPAVAYWHESYETCSQRRPIATL
jgi:hypothetical protein